ncbi:MAG: hypothetical protein CSA75_05135 [Sorangium cellulosum]|nr:MAG: hypothetical protein CSA75_05135 [Sorangium cellulosum]
MGGRYGVGAALHAYFAGIAMGIVTPGRTGEFFRAAYPVHAGVVPLEASIASVLLDRLFDLTLLLVLSFCAGLWLVPGWWVLPVVGGLLGGALLLPKLVSRGDHLLTRLIRKTPLGSDRYVGFKAAFRAGSGQVVPATLLTLAGYSVMQLQVFWIARALGVEIGFVELLLYFSLANTFALLPISLSGLGTREAALGFLFALTGRPPLQGVTVSLAFFALMALPVTGAGGVALLLPARLFHTE